MAHVMPFPNTNFLCLYRWTFCSMCKVSTMTVFCSSWMSCSPVTLLRSFVYHFEAVQLPLFLVLSLLCFILQIRCIYYGISHFLALVGKYSPILGFSNQQH